MTDSTLDKLLAIEHALAAGTGDTYRERLRDDAVVIVPGQALTLEETAAAMDVSPGWDTFALDDPRVLPLGETAALLIYRFTGHRGEDTYSALMTSAYVSAGDEWRLVLHQQTPLPG